MEIREETGPRLKGGQIEKDGCQGWTKARKTKVVKQPKNQGV